MFRPHMKILFPTHAHPPDEQPFQPGIQENVLSGCSVPGLSATRSKPPIYREGRLHGRRSNRSAARHVDGALGAPT